MTNERQQPDSTAETDETVSATYRELSWEGAPNHLNEKVLQQAAERALRPRYSRSVMWTRPLAWVATVGLCLAIVLEVTRVPTAEIVMTDDANSFLEAKPSSIAEEAQAPAQAPPQAPPQAPVRQRPEALKDMKSQLGRSAAKQAANEPKREIVDTDTRQQSGAIAALAVSATRIDSEATNECPDEIRVDPVTWLACIVDLEESGDTDAALRQRDALEKTFPQFKMP